jgi:hypothetical protein
VRVEEEVVFGLLAFLLTLGVGWLAFTIYYTPVVDAPLCINPRTNTTVDCPPGVPGYLPPLPANTSLNWSVIM